jgi:hypothetical protein
MKFGFKKYEYENIRTDYKEFNDASFKVPTKTVDGKEVEIDAPAGSILIATTNHTHLATGTAIPTKGSGETHYYLAEDVKVGDKGAVIYIIENVDNLEVR